MVLTVAGILLIATALLFYEKKYGDLEPQIGLPKAVEQKRQAIFKAATAGDYEALTAEADPSLNYSFGGPHEKGFVGFLKLSEQTEGQSALDIIPRLLELPYAYQANIYVWPNVFYKAPNEWKENDIELMKKLVSLDQIEKFREFGGYVYYRLGITKEGNWVFYIAGD